MKHNTSHEDQSEHRDFWTEVLVGRSIKELKFSPTNDLTALVLDNGEVFFLDATSHVKVD